MEDALRIQKEAHKPPPANVDQAGWKPGPKNKSPVPNSGGDFTPHIAARFTPHIGGRMAQIPTPHIGGHLL